MLGPAAELLDQSVYTPSAPESATDSGLLELTDPLAIDEVLRTCLRAKPMLDISIAGRVERTRAVRSADLALIAFQTNHFLRDEACTLRFQIHGVMFVLTGRARTLDGGLGACLPERLFCLDRRVVARQALAPGHAELEWSEPELGELQVARGAVHDFTPSGLGLVVDPNHTPVPGATFAATIRVGNIVVPCLAKRQRTAALDGATVGVSIRPARGVRTMIEAYLRERHPQLAPRHSAGREELRSLLERSGYLELRSHGGNFDAWHRNRPRATLSADMVYRAQDGQLLGHISATQAYRRTWMWHQLACLPGHGESGECRLMLYALAAAAPGLYHGSGVRALAYFNPERRWHQVFFQSFLSWMNDPTLATLCYFDRFERERPELPWEDFEPADCEVRVASAERELMRAAALVRGHLPETVADALDIHPGELRRPTVRFEERGREVLTLYERGELVGVCLCEQGDPDLSLFNIFNIAQVYVRTGSRAPSVAAQRMLVAKARAVYTARGVDDPLVIAPRNTLDRNFEPGTHWVESMGCVVIADRGLRQFENFCRFHFGRRWRRHSSAQKGRDAHE